MKQHDFIIILTSTQLISVIKVIISLSLSCYHHSTAPSLGVSCVLNVTTNPALWIFDLNPNQQSIRVDRMHCLHTHGVTCSGASS